MYQLFRRPPMTGNTPPPARSAAVAKRRLCAALPADRALPAGRHDDSKRLLSRLLQEDLCPPERRPA